MSPFVEAFFKPCSLPTIPSRGFQVGQGGWELLSLRPRGLQLLPLRWEPLVQAATAEGSLFHPSPPPGARLALRRGEAARVQQVPTGSQAPCWALEHRCLRPRSCHREVPSLPTRTSRCSSNPQTELKPANQSAGLSPAPFPLPHPGRLVSKGCTGSEEGGPRSQRLSSCIS